MPRTVLHIGAHKTATTYMQKKLALNIDMLAKRGIRYDPLDVLRKNFTPLLNEKAVDETEYLAKLHRESKTQDVMFSEENILGVPGDLVRAGVYYAKAGERLSIACRVMDTDTPELFMGLRDYSSFTVSMYSEYIRHRDFIRFPEYFELYEASGFSWVNVIEEVIATVPRAKITIWDFAKFRMIEKDVFSAMIGFDSSLLSEPEGPVRESFSEIAMVAFEALLTVLTPQELRKVIGPIARSLPKNEQYPGFNPMAPDAVARLRAQYQADLLKIAEKFPAVEFIGGV